MIVEDHPIVRLGIRQMIGAERDLEVCGETEGASMAVDLAATTRPHLVLVDLSLPEGTGLDLIRALRGTSPDVLILVLSMHDETLYAERVLRAGARGYIMKREAITGLVDAIRTVLSGRVYVSDALAQTVLERLAHEHGTADHPLAPLSDRELQVFDLIGRGLSTAAIANELQVSTKTVETYRSNIKTKLNLKDAVELIRFAVARAEHPESL